ncbi:hypothetical protein EKE94_13910 [Mesobaculum littorinae]|uniref:Sulfotransferase family protein n=1 Tax=Mesobaculum littorinae TaxID=2486419 RepID=A0A438AFY2_9RHOB|nr:hypothetical protein [Mesobaculum littorinae]RVV97621.1 hypothetical protein EKE94_13910 [Mesobaculum littorinae]
MTRTLYLHIGTHRTATTSIQRFLLRNFDALIAEGCLLPFRKPRHFEMINAIFAGQRTIADAAARMNERADSKAPVDITKLVVSDEDICMRKDLSLLGEFREHFDVKVIYSLRRQDLWLESWYFQNIKWQWNPALSHCTFDEFLARRDQFHWIHYDGYVRHLEEVFGAENVAINVFEKEQMPDGPVAAFCEAAGLQALLGNGTEPHVNSSMSAAMAEFARHLPMDEFPPAQRELLRRAMEGVDRNVFGHTGKQSERLMPPELRQAILSDYEAGNRALAQRRFGREALFEQPLPAADAPLAQLAIPQDSQGLIDQFVAPLLRQMVEKGMITAPAAPKKG